MSKASEAPETPDTVVVSPDLDKAHRSGDGFEPACIDRLHNVGDVEWRITTTDRIDEDDRCGHHECFGGER